MTACGSEGGVELHVVALGGKQPSCTRIAVPLSFLPNLALWNEDLGPKRVTRLVVAMGKSKGKNDEGKDDAETDDEVEKKKESKKKPKVEQKADKRTNLGDTQTIKRLMDDAVIAVSCATGCHTRARLSLRSRAYTS